MRILAASLMINSPVSSKGGAIDEYLWSYFHGLLCLGSLFLASSFEANPSSEHPPGWRTWCACFMAFVWQIFLSWDFDRRVEPCPFRSLCPTSVRHQKISHSIIKPRPISACCRFHVPMDVCGRHLGWGGALCDSSKLKGKVWLQMAECCHQSDICKMVLFFLVSHSHNRSNFYRVWDLSHTNL